MFGGGLVAIPLGIQLAIVVPIAAIVAILLGSIVSLVGALVVINARRVLSPCRMTDTTCGSRMHHRSRSDPTDTGS